MWLWEESYEGVISSTRNKPIIGISLFQVCEKIRFTHYAILAWKKEVFSSMKAETTKVQEKFGVLFDHPPLVKLYEAREELMGHLNSLLSREETYLRQ